MKKKLELLLNKVVVFNQPNVVNFKGFLYKDDKKYYIKVVEVTEGSLNFNEKYYLEKGDDKFIVVAEHPKLMQVSKNSWHYKLMKYVLRSNTPTPKDMQNGCPYFWLLLFSIIVVPFILIAKSIYYVVMLFPKALFWVLGQMINNWISELEDEVAYDMYWGGDSKMPRTAKIFFDNSDDSFYDFFLSKKYANLDKKDPDYNEKRVEIREKWEKWRDKLSERRREQRKLLNEKEIKLEESRREQYKKREEARARWNARMQPIRDGFKEFGASFKKTFTVKRGRVNMIVKRTKQFVGAVVTLVILGLTFVAVNYIALGLMIFIDWSISNWEVYLVVVLLVVAFGILYLLYVLISSWLQGVVNKYRGGKKIWYIEPFIYVVFYPLKYIALAIAFLILNVIWIPISFIFYTILFNWFLKPIGLFIAKLFINLIKGIGSSSGIFGEYFGASYSDYCPGIEWTDFNED